MRRIPVAAVLLMSAVLLCQTGGPWNSDASCQVSLSFQPSFGESLFYRIETTTNANVNGTPTRVLGDVRLAVFLKKVVPNPAKGDTLIQKQNGVLPDSLIEIGVRYEKMDYGYYVNDKPLEMKEMAEQRNKLVGRTMSIRLTKDGKLAGWTIPRGLGYGEDELDMGQAIAASLSSFLFPLPEKPLVFGTSWDRSFEYPVRSKRGGQIDTKVVESYTFQGTTKKKKDDCAKLKFVNTETSEGEIEVTQDRQKAKVWVDSESSESGELLFSIQRGRILESTSTTKQETSSTVTRTGSTKAEEFTYTSEVKTKITLVEK